MHCASIANKLHQTDINATATTPETTNTCAIDNDINRNGSNMPTIAQHARDDIIVPVQTTNSSNNTSPTPNIILAFEFDDTTNIDKSHGDMASDSLYTQAAVSINDNNQLNASEPFDKQINKTNGNATNYAQTNQLNGKQKQQHTELVPAHIDQIIIHNSLDDRENKIERDNVQQPPQIAHKYAENSAEIISSHQTDCAIESNEQHHTIDIGVINVAEAETIREQKTDTMNPTNANGIICDSNKSVESAGIETLECMHNNETNEIEEQIDSDLFITESKPLLSIVRSEVEWDESIQNDDSTTSTTGDELNASAKRLKRTPSQYLQPAPYLQAISEENSDASDIDANAQIIAQQTPKLCENKANKANVIYPHSNYDFSRMARHTNLIAPANEVINEEPQRCLLVDARIIEPEVMAARYETLQKSIAEQQDQAELVYLDTSSSNNSLSDFESSGMDGDAEDSNSFDDGVRIETPIIGSNACSAFVPIAKPLSSNQLASPKMNIQESLSNTSNKLLTIQNRSNPSLPIDANENQITQSECSFIPISEREFLREMLEMVAASMPCSDTDDSDAKETFDTPIAHEPTTTHTEYNTSSHEPYKHCSPTLHIAIADTEIDLETNKQTVQYTAQHDTNPFRLLSPQFKIGEACSNNMFAPPTNCLANASNLSNSQVNNGEFNRQDSSSSHCSASTTHTESTARYLSGLQTPTTPNDLTDFPEPSPSLRPDILKPLHLLCSERLQALPFGNIILDEVNKATSSQRNSGARRQTGETKCTDKSVAMPYPPPKLPEIDSLEIEQKAQQRPVPPPRRNLKLVPSYKGKLSPSPPPVPQRPWLGVPTKSNPNVLVCLSPAQRGVYEASKENTALHSQRNNNAPDRLLDAHNKFVDRRGYYEYTDDEVKAINSPEPYTRQTAQAHSKTKDDNRLLALIREINQLTHTDANSQMSHIESIDKYPVSNSPLNISSSSQKQSEHEPIKMSRSLSGNSFNNKHFSQYFDELSRLHPIAEESSKITMHSTTTTAEATIAQATTTSSLSEFDKSRKYENPPNSGDSNVVTSNTTENRSSRKTIELCANGSDDDPANRRYCKYDQCKNSDSQTGNTNNTENSKAHSTGDSSIACAMNVLNESKEIGERSRFSFKEFDFVPKLFSNFFRSTKVEETHAVSEQSIDTDTIAAPTSLPCAANSFGSSENAADDRCSLHLPAELTPKYDERHMSTQSLYEIFSGVSEGSASERPPSVNNMCAKSVNRISPNPIRAPRITESMPPESNATASSWSGSFDWCAAQKAQRQYENRQSMTDYRTSRQRFDRRSVPNTIVTHPIEYILQRERQLEDDFDKLEYDRLRLLRELDELVVNQGFENVYKEHKRRNSLNPNFSLLNESEMLRKQMQDEWLSKVAEREERRLQKIIKVTHNAKDVPSLTASHTNRGLGDEFLDRVRERRTKLQIPSDSELDNSGEQQTIEYEPNSSHIDPNVRIIDDGHETDLDALPKHLREFAEFTSSRKSIDLLMDEKQDFLNAINAHDDGFNEVEGKDDAYSRPSDTMQNFEPYDMREGESVIGMRLMLFGLCLALAIMLWSYCFVN